MNNLYKCKLMLLQMECELFFKSRNHMITEIRKLQDDCKEILQEDLKLYFENNTITCYDTNDLTIFRCVYERLQ